MMQILQTGTFKKILNFKFQISNLRNFKNSTVHCSLFTVHCLKGFTFIELIVVIAIISIAMTLIMPSFWDIGRNSVKTEAKHISSTLRYIYEEAVGKKQIYSVNFNLDNESWGFKSKDETRDFRIKRDVEIKDVVIPSHGEISKGEVTIEFGPIGPEEPIILHLKKDEFEYTVIFNQLNGRAKILEGYKF